MMVYRDPSSPRCNGTGSRAVAPRAARPTDLSRRLLQASLLWGVPLAAIFWSGYSSFAIAWIWPLAFGFMGGACLWNAARCRRVHCHVTGPLFLVAAVLSALHAWGIASLGENALAWIANGAFLGALILGCLTEALLGRYFGRSS